MPAEESRGGHHILLANRRTRYDGWPASTWPGSQHGKGQPAPLQGEHVNLSTPAGELIGLQNTVGRASRPACQCWPKAACGGRRRQESEAASGREGQRVAEGPARCPELAAGWAACSSWLSILGASSEPPGWGRLAAGGGGRETRGWEVLAWKALRAENAGSRPLASFLH